MPQPEDNELTVRVFLGQELSGNGRHGTLRRRSLARLVQVRLWRALRWLVLDPLGRMALFYVALVILVLL